MATHTVHRAGSWYTRLADVIAAAKRGDVVVVADTEMMEYACFGVRSRGLTTLSERGIRVHLADAPGVAVDVEKGTAVGTGPSAVNVPKNPLGDLRPTMTTHVPGVGIVPGVPNADDDGYPDGTRFVCQACAREYTFGDAKKAFEGQGDVLPLCFCGTACRDKYVAHHKRLPLVGAEIILGRGTCNLGFEAPKVE